MSNMSPPYGIFWEEKTMAKHLNCKCCQKPIILVPSAEERAAKDRNGNTAAYYRNLFKTCSDCQIKSWYAR